MIGLNSGDSVDLKSYSEDMCRILDAYIKATDSKTLIKIEDQGLCEVLAQMDINDFNKELSEVFKNVSFKRSLSFKLNSIKNHLEI
ncbi:hypothetical protein BTM314_15010 [Helicobacter pylori]